MTRAMRAYLQRAYFLPLTYAYTHTYTLNTRVLLLRPTVFRSIRPLTSRPSFCVRARVQLGGSVRVRQVAAGGMHSLALAEDGSVWTWGEPWGDFSMNLTQRIKRVSRAGTESRAWRLEHSAMDQRAAQERVGA